MEKVKKFYYEKSEVRAAIHKGEPAFCLGDLILLLDIKDYKSFIRELDESEIIIKRLKKKDGTSVLLAFITEFNFYKLLVKADAPDNEVVIRWLTDDVMAILKKEIRIRDEERLLKDPDTILKIARVLKEGISDKKNLEDKIKKDKHKVLFAESIKNSKGCILIGDLAKLIRQNGINIGQNRLFKWLRENNYLCRRKGGQYNQPTQHSMDLGLFEIKERTKHDKERGIRTMRTTMVTGKGQIYFMNLFMNMREEL